ncbi:unnamed protein product [Didymodactylos carnosus]|uniref:Uncharacterized protein n=1 Tax=Didymodactylos carnosus TaxID=1234261 RepID=A0A815FCV6_9BILA|nr:unnamed protein product [Didymodactylos carnosus]CAF4171469.1 unnamed protein product [Didymodactylos carnosus]
MGGGGSVINKYTKDLWSIVDNNASHHTSPVRAQKLMQDGGDIKRPNKNGQYMIQIVMEQEKRNRLAGLIQQADVCQQLADTLKAHASKLLVDALDRGDIGEMKVLVQCFGADRCQCGQSFGPLGLIGHAVRKPDLTMETIEFLVENETQNKFAITRQDTQGQTVFTLAKCQQQIVDYLKETDDKGNTVLCNAVLANNLDLVKHLVAAQSNTQHTNLLKQKPLSIAKNAAQKNPLIIAFLENEGINRRLQSLIRERKADLTQMEVQDLLKQGADINVLGPNNDSLLHLLVANNGTPELISVFVNSFNADIEMMNLNGHRPIEACIVHDKVEQLEAFFKLTKVGTEHFSNQKLNKSLLTFATEQNTSSKSIVKAVQNELNLRLWKCISMANKQEAQNPPIMAEAKRLCDLGAQLNYLHIEIGDSGGEYNQWFVLHLACKISNLQLVRFLIETLDANKEGAQPISITAEYGQMDIVQFLRLSGSKVNVISNKDTKDTPLHLAAKNNHLLTVRYLVLWGADHEAKNDANQTPLDLVRIKKAKMTREDEVQSKQLIQYLEQLNCPDVEEREQRRPMSPKTIDPAIDVCDIPLPVLVDQIQPHDVRDEDPKGEKSLGLFTGAPNGNLRAAAKDGNIDLAKATIGEGADIRHREGNDKRSC